MTTAAADTLQERLRAALAPNLLLVREIGAGGMARVFLAREPALKRLVAVKVLSGELASTQAGRARFEREAQAVAGLSHPNVVAVHSVGELADGTPYFIMQFVDGRSMAERVEREGPVSVAEARRTLGEVAAALAAAHKQGIIHRDVKPANILYEDATGRSLVSDFGIAAIGRETPTINTKLTATGAIVGTPQYMSPEQLLAEPVTEKTDIYSLGLLAHELLCGSAPFKGSSPHELIAAHLRDVPARLVIRRPDVDAELDDVVARCLEKTAARRPTAEEVAKRLVPGAGALLEWPPPGLEDLHGRLRRISSVFMAGGLSLGAALVTMTFAGPTMASVLFSVATFGLLVLMVASVVAIVIGLVRALRASTLVARAIRSGYGWMTVAETMADVRGDTGNLIAASREYAGLKPEQRDVHRLNRVKREMVLVTGGIAAIPAFLLLVMLGSSGLAPWQATIVALLVPVAALGFAFVLGRREDRAFAPLRQKRAAVSAADVSRLAPVWYGSFETVRVGQRVGRGGMSRANAGRRVAVVATVAVAVMIVLLVPLAIAGTFGPTVWAIAVPKFANTLEKVRISNLTRGYALPKDPRITALDAGNAFYTLQANSPRNSGAFTELPLRDSIPPAPWNTDIPAGVLTSARFDNAPRVPSPLTIFAAYRRGFSSADLAHLERLASAPQWKYWDIMARANRMDFLGARYRLPFAADAHHMGIPIARFSATKEVAYASAARAAYHVARGRRDSAEAALRATMSVGFLLIDEGNSLIDVLIGAVIVGIGRQSMIDYYKAIGDPRGAQLQAVMDSVNAALEARAGEQTTDRLLQNVDVREAAAIRGAIIRAATDPREVRGFRNEMLYLLAATPCTNLRELVFGPTTAVREAFELNRARFARFASDSAVLDLMQESAERANAELFGLRVTPPMRVARALGAMLGNKRLGGCTTMVLVYGS